MPTSKPLSLLCYSDNFYPEPNAAASRVYEKARYWAQEGHQVTVITSCPNFPTGIPFEGYKNKWRSSEVQDGIRVIRVKTYISANKGFFRRTLDFLSYMLSASFFSIFEKRHDFVIASSPQFFTMFAGLFSARWHRTPFVLEIADLWPESVETVGALRSKFILRLLEKAELFLYRRAKLIVALSDSIRQDIARRGIPAEKIKTIINGVDLEYYSQPRPDPLAQSILQKFDKNFVVGYFGTFGMAHNLLRVVKAAKILETQGVRPIHFLLVGAGADFEFLKKYVSDQKIGNVTLLNLVPKTTIAHFWLRADIGLIHLKHNATFTKVIPSKIFDGIASETPILYCGPESDGSRIVTEYGLGIHHKDESPESLAAAVLRLYNAPSELNRFKENSRSNQHLFTRKNQAAQFIECLTQLGSSH